MNRNAHWTGARSETHKEQYQRAQNLGTGGGERRAGNPPARAPYGEGVAEKGDIMGGIDQQIVAVNIVQIDADVDDHRGAAVAEAAEDGGEHHHQAAEQHGEGDDADVALRVIQYFWSAAHPDGDLAGEHEAQHRKRNAQRENDNDRLPDQLAGVLKLLGADRAGNHGGEADAQRHDHRVDQVDRALADGDRGGGIGAECPDHGGVDRLNQRDQNLLNKDWPGQHDDDEQWMLGLVRYRNNAMLHNTLLFK